MIGKIKQAIEIIIEVIPILKSVLSNLYPNKKIGIYSTWLDNRTKLVGDGLAQTNHLKVDYKPPECSAKVN